jgi:hypothetical protein
MAINIFGYEIAKSLSKGKEKEVVSPIPKVDDEDGLNVTVGGGYFGQYVDLSESGATSDHDLIRKYREVALQPECDLAIADIVDAAIASSDDKPPVSLKFTASHPEEVEKAIVKEFKNVLKLYKFNRRASEYFRNWYVDGKSYFNVIVNSTNPQKGITEIRPIEATHINKIREVKTETDEKTKVEYEKVVDEYYVYSPEAAAQTSGNINGVKIANDAIIQTNSGIKDSANLRTLGHLHKALKLANQLRYMEDSLVVYRVSRAPERRIFYIDVGNLPKGKAEEYVQQVVSRYRNKLVYDATTGNITDDRRHMSMLEDFYLPRREGGRGTEITTLSGGENLGQIEDVLFFQKKLYRALNVPVARLEQETQYTTGKSNEISREEVKFQKFIDRLRKRFAYMLLDALRIQLILKGVIVEKDWANIEQSINIDFLEDNYFAELKEFEILRERLEMAQMLEDLVGKYISNEYVRKTILRQSSDDIARLDKEIAAEKEASGDVDEDEDF